VKLGSLLLTWRFIDNDMRQSNVNLFVLVLVLAGAWMIVRGWPMLAGALVAVAVSIKVTPALVLVYFAYKGWWRAIMGAVAGAFIALWVLPALWIGWAPNCQAMMGWFDHVIVSFVSRADIGISHINQSLTAILRRLLSREVAIPPDTYINVVNLPFWAFNALRHVLSAIILIVLAIVCRGRLSWDQTRFSFSSRGDVLAFCSELALVLVAMLMLSGYSWKAHFVTMLVPYTVLLSWLADFRHDGNRLAVGVLTAISFVLCTITSDCIGPVAANYAEAYGLIGIGALAAGAGLLLVRGQIRRQQKDSPIITI
jgi:uncharacterized membrane protein